jgi:DNA-binding protein H-NS
LLRQAYDEMMRRELRRLTVLEEKAAGVKKTRAKPTPTHRSKKDRKLNWSGRGSMPRWIREEMKAMKLKPDAFFDCQAERIARRFPCLAL